MKRYAQLSRQAKARKRKAARRYISRYGVLWKMVGTSPTVNEKKGQS